MSCKECDRIQELNKEGKSCAYLRIDGASILIGACDKHFNRLREQLGHDIGVNEVVFRTK